MKKINPNEPFSLNGVIYTYSVLADGKSIELKKVREIKEKPPKPAFIPPTLDQVKAFFKEKGYIEELAIRAFNYYESSEPIWHDGNGRPVKMWKQKIVNNWFKPEYMINPEQPEKKETKFVM